MSSMKQPHMLEGNISVKAALLAKRRPFYKLIVDIKKRDRDTAFILKEAQKRKIIIEKKNRFDIDEEKRMEVSSPMLENELSTICQIPVMNIAFLRS